MKEDSRSSKQKRMDLGFYPVKVLVHKDDRQKILNLAKKLRKEKDNERNK